MKNKPKSKQNLTRDKHNKRLPGTHAKLTQKRVARAIIGSYGIISSIARRCKVSRKAIYDFLNRQPNNDFREQIEFESESSLDLSEEQLIKHLKRGREWAIKFNLSTKGKKRGFGYKLEFEDKSLNLDPIMEKLRNDKKNPKRIEYLERIISGEDPKTVLLEYERTL